MIIAESLFQTIELVLSRESCPFTIHCNRTVMKQDSFKEHLDCDACMFFYSPFFLSKSNSRTDVSPADFVQKLEYRYSDSLVYALAAMTRMIGLQI